MTSPRASQDIAKVIHSLIMNHTNQERIQLILSVKIQQLSQTKLINILPIHLSRKNARF